MGRITGTLAIVLSTFVILAAYSCAYAPNDPLKGNFKVYPGTPDEAAAESSAPPAGQPLLLTPPQPASPVERQVTVTASNSVFSIGLPAGYTEEREIKAQKPIDVWFEYLPSENITLEVNGQAVQIP